MERRPKMNPKEEQLLRVWTNKGLRKEREKKHKEWEWKYEGEWEWGQGLNAQERGGRWRIRGGGKGKEILKMSWPDRKDFKKDAELVRSVLSCRKDMWGEA